jgi:hypothetical protein
VQFSLGQGVEPVVHILFSSGAMTAFYRCSPKQLAKPDQAIHQTASCSRR